jgi:hypothetical protein
MPAPHFFRLHPQKNKRKTNKIIPVRVCEPVSEVLHRLGSRLSPPGSYRCGGNRRRCFLEYFNLSRRECPKQGARLLMRINEPKHRNSHFTDHDLIEKKNYNCLRHENFLVRGQQFLLPAIQKPGTGRSGEEWGSVLAGLYCIAIAPALST